MTLLSPASTMSMLAAFEMLSGGAADVIEALQLNRSPWMALNGVNSKLLVVLPGDDSVAPILIPLPFETIPSELYHSTIIGSVMPSGNSTEQEILYG